MGRVYVLVGIPRCGKTTWTQANKAGKVVVNADTIRNLVYGQRYWQEGEPLMWSIRGIVLRMLMSQGQDIIIDETNTTIKRRSDILTMAKEMGYKATAVVFTTTKETCMLRAVKAADDAIIPVISRMVEQYQAVEEDEGFDEIIQV